MNRRQTAAKALEFPLAPYSLWLCEYYFLINTKVIVWGKTAGHVLSFCRCCAPGDPRVVLQCAGQSPMSSRSCFPYLESGINEYMISKAGHMGCVISPSLLKYWSIWPEFPAEPTFSVIPPQRQVSDKATWTPVLSLRCSHPTPPGWNLWYCQTGK